MRHGDISWPGAIGIRSVSYSISHGITPGIAVLVTLPQPTAPDLAGNLIIGDGVNAVIIPDCKVQSIQARGPDPGFTWLLEIADRRWKWREMGILPGVYNAPDPTGWFSRPPPDAGPQIGSTVKYIQWTVQEPEELMALCLDAMGETGYTINMPPFSLDALPAVNWDYCNPALALQTLCEAFGCRVVYRLDTDTVLITPVGIGDDLPDGPLGMESPAVNIPPRPDSIVLIGAPVRYQTPLVLLAVGEEWDGSLRPIDDLSYTPTLTETRQKVQVTPDGVTVGVTFALSISGDGLGVNDYAYETLGGDTATVVSTYFMGQINTLLGPKGFTASLSGANLIILGPTNGATFSTTTSVDPNNRGSSMEWTLLDAAVQKKRTWRYSCPPDFPNVTITDRLTYFQAQDLARKSVFRYFQVANLDPRNRDGPPPLIIPNFGALDRREQILLENTQVDQAFPAPLDWNVRDQGTDAPLIQNYYDGYSRERIAEVYGSYCDDTHHVRTLSLKRDVDLNLPATGKVYETFSIDAEKQLVMFSNHVFVRVPGGVDKPVLTLLTAFQLRDKDTNQVVRTQAVYNLPPPLFGTQAAVVKHEDVQLLLAQRYNPALFNWLALDSNAAQMQLRAGYYLQAEALKYLITGGLTRRYNCIQPVWLDGAIQQVTWEVGEGGALTTASRNTEHAFDRVIPYPARLRLEYLRSPERLRVGAAGQGNPMGQPVPADRGALR